jgi:hypothetical protein
MAAPRPSVDVILSLPLLVVDIYWWKSMVIMEMVLVLLWRPFGCSWVDFLP